MSSILLIVVIYLHCNIRLKFSGINISDFFSYFHNWKWFCSVSIFSQPFAYGVCWNSEVNISLEMLVIIIYGGFGLFMKILNFNDCLEMSWRYKKSYGTLVPIVVCFERFYVVPHSCKVFKPELTWFKIYDRGGSFASAMLFNVKNA